MTDNNSVEREDCVRFLAFAGLVATALFIPAFLATCHGPFPLPVDGGSVPLGRDFVNTWAYGRAFFDPHPGRFYDRALYESALQALLPQNTVTHLWSYAPPFLIIAAPFGLLPYPVALATWTALGPIALGAATRMYGSRWLVISVLTTPMAIFAMIFGQASLFVTALILVAVREFDRRPALAGFALSLLALKPQPLILMPIFLIASRRWKVLAAATAGTFLLVLVSIAFNGLETWSSFVRLGLPTQLAEVKASLDNLMAYSATISAEAYEAGLPEHLILALQGVATIVAACLVTRVGLRSRRDGAPTREYEALVVLAASVVATPYLLIHDLVGLSTLLIIVSYREGLVRSRSLLLMMLYVPLLHVFVALLGVHILAAMIVAMTIWLFERGHGRAFVTPRYLSAPSPA